MENNDLVLSLIMGGFLLSVIIPLGIWVYNANKEKEHLKKIKPTKESSSSQQELLFHE